MPATVGTHCATAMGMWIVRLAFSRSYAFVATTLLLSLFTSLCPATDFFRAMTTREI